MTEHDFILQIVVIIIIQRHLSNLNLLRTFMFRIDTCWALQVKLTTFFYISTLFKVWFTQDTVLLLLHRFHYTWIYKHAIHNFQCALFIEYSVKNKHFSFISIFLLFFKIKLFSPNMVIWSTTGLVWGNCSGIREIMNLVDLT